MNPISGTSSKAAVPSLIDSTLDKEQFEYEIKMTERPGHASELAAEARDNHADIVVAVGGDGTVNEVARSLVHSDSALGILPCGSMDTHRLPYTSEVHDNSCIFLVIVPL